MQNFKPISTLMSLTKKLTIIDGNVFKGPQYYCNVVGSFQYLSFTRLDISFAMNKICWYMHTPQLLHWQVVKCILHYLNHICTFGLYFYLLIHLISLAFLMHIGLAVQMIIDPL